MDNKNPEDWYENLTDRELNPTTPENPEERHGLRDRARDEISEHGKDAAGKAAKQAFKKGSTKAAGTAASEAAGTAGATAGAAGASGGAAAGAGIAATTGIETAGVGVAVGAAVAVLSSKKARNIFILILVIPILLFILFIPSMALLSLKVATTGISDLAMKVVKEIPVVRGAKIVSNGIGYAADKAAVAAEAAGSIRDEGITILGEGAELVGGLLGGLDSSFAVGLHDPLGKSVARSSVVRAGAQLAAISAGDVARTPLKSDSRLAVLYDAMQDEGYFQKVLEKNHVKVIYTKDKKFKIFSKKRLVKTVSSADEIGAVFENDQVLSDLVVLSLKDDLKVWNYSQRVTLAEKAKENYGTERLYLPGADSATDDEDVAKVKQNSKSLVNNPTIDELSGSLKCTFTDCGGWAKTAITKDNSNIVKGISAESGYKTPGTLDSVMRQRFRTAAKSDDLSPLEMFKYIVELKKAAELKDETAIKNNTFIQGLKETRKDQSARLWFHTQTMVDQFMANKITSKSAAALFQDFNDIGGAKAYGLINGKQNGAGFKEYEKVNDDQKNIAATIYNSWKQDKPKYADLIDRAAVYFDAAAADDTANTYRNFINTIASEDVEAAIESAYDFASQATIPRCDSTQTGEVLMNCLFAGAQVSARDIGISDYGLNGEISEADRTEMLSYVNDSEQRIASNRPLRDRIFSTELSTSVLSTLIRRAAIPFDTASNPASMIRFLAATPTLILSSVPNPLSHNVSADDDLSKVNNIKNAGVKIGTLKNTPLSSTLNEASGGNESCPAAEKNKESMCLADETTYKALAARFDLYSLTYDSENTGAGSNFRIATYNLPIRAGEAGYSKATANIKTFKFDIVGMQELAGPNYRYIQRVMKEAGYGIYPDKKLSEPLARSAMSTQSILYKTDKFELVKTSTFSYPRYRQDSAGKSGDESWEEGMSNAPIVWLRDKTTSQVIIVMNTHNAAYEGNAQRRYNAALIYIDVIRRLKQENPGLPILFTGDFNEGMGVRTQPGTNLTYEGKYQNLLYCMFAQNKLMINTEALAAGRGTICPNPSSGDVDYIYATSGVQAKDYKEILDSASDHPTEYVDITVPGTGKGEWVWPIKKANWPSSSLPIAECGLAYSEGTVHTGIDMSVGMGTDVVAATDATVTYVGGGYGAIIAKTKQKTPNGDPIYLNYQHLSKIDVKYGDDISPNQVIGKSGKTGTDSPHLHFGVWKTGSFLSGHDSLNSTQGKATLALMLHPLNYLPKDGRALAECKEPYVVP